MNKVLDSLELTRGLQGKDAEFDCVRTALLREGVLLMYKELSAMDATTALDEIGEG